MTDISSICVYCGSRDGGRSIYRETALAFGRALAERGIRLVYGGGHVGLMGAVSDGALQAGGEVVGIIPHHLFRQEVAHRGIADLRVVDSMHARKHLMFELSDAFVVLPGGIGTLDETFEIISWRQLRLHDQPVILLDDHGYWQPFAALVDHNIASGFADPGVRGLFRLAADVDEVFRLLAAAPTPERPADSGRF